MLKKLVSMVFLLVAAVWASGCTSAIGTRPLASYPQAVAIPGPERPKVLDAVMAEGYQLPELIPYLVITGSGDAGVDTLVRKIWWESAEHNADLVLVVDKGLHYVGSTTSYWGWASPHGATSTTVSTPIYSRVVQGVCYKYSPGRLGILADAEGTVVRARADLKIQVGDRLMTIDGFPFKSTITSGHFTRLLNAKPGDALEVVWLRPGVGPMSEKVRLQKNTEPDPSWPDAVSWEPPPVRYPDEPF